MEVKVENELDMEEQFNKKFELFDQKVLILKNCLEMFAKEKEKEELETQDTILEDIRRDTG